MINAREEFPQLFEDGLISDELFDLVDAEYKERWPNWAGSHKFMETDQGLFLKLLCDALRPKLADPESWILEKLFPNSPKVGDVLADGQTVIRKELSMSGGFILALKSKDGRIQEADSND